MVTLNRAISGEIICIWVMNGAQEFRSDTNRNVGDGETLTAELGGLFFECKGRNRLTIEDLKG